MDFVTLQKHIKDKKVLFFCGAGISIDPPAGLPNWNRFRDLIIETIGDKCTVTKKYIEVLKNYQLIASSYNQIGITPELVASEIQRVTEKYFLVFKAFEIGKPNANHIALARLAKERFLTYIITTNFDSYIEQALDIEGVNYSVCSTDNDFQEFLSDSQKQECIIVFKLHGCINKPNTITATIEQEGIGLSIAKKLTLDRLLNEFYFCFWGYSGADLKIDLDYLRMLTVKDSALGFYWNMYKSDSFKEKINPNVTKLLNIYSKKGQTEHSLFPSVFENIIDYNPPIITDEEQSKCSEKRNRELLVSLTEWAEKYIDDGLACTIVGHLLYLCGRFEYAIECYTKMAEIGHVTCDSRLEGAAYIGLGNVYRLLVKPIEAIESYQKSLEYITNIKERIISLCNLGGLLGEQGNIKDAINVLDSALNLAFEVNDRESIGSIYARKATIHTVTGSRDEALELYESAAKLFKEIGEKLQLIECLNNQAGIYNLFCDYSLAKQYHNEALDISTMLGNKVQMCRSLQGIGTTLIAENEILKARKAFQHALNIAEDINSDSCKVGCLMGLAQIDIFEDAPNKALKKLIESENIYINERNHAGYVRVLLNLQTVYRILKQWEKAIEVGHKAVNLLEEINDRSLAVFAYRETASIYLNELDNKEKAKYGLKIALTYSRLENMVDSESILKELMDCNGKSSLEERIERAIKKDKIIKNVVDSLISMDEIKSIHTLHAKIHEIAVFQNKQNNKNEAYIYWRALATISWEMDDEYWFAGALNEMGMIFNSLDMTIEAQKYFKSAGDIAKKVNDWRQLSMCQYNNGVTLYLLGENKMAKLALLESQNCSIKMRDSESQKIINEAIEQLNSIEVSR